MSIQSEFADYLIARGYKDKTPKGKPSTVQKYVRSINAVCSEEGCSWDELARGIYKIFSKYENNFLKCDIGKQGHKTIINALTQYKKFCFDYCNI